MEIGGSGRLHHVAYESVGFVAEADAARFGDRLKPRGKVRFGANDRPGNRYFLNAADVTLPPVLFRAERVRIVATDTDLSHQYRRCGPNHAIQR